MAYSQNDEEKYILDYFNGFIGTLIDIGANDGKTFSNSKALIDLGWTAFLYEPSPSAYLACKSLYSGNKKVKVINKAVTDSHGEMTFYDSADTLLSSLKKELSDRSPSKEIKVKCIPYSDVKAVADFITIDAEGMDFIILKQIDLSNVKMICIEHGNSFEIEAREYCETFGMKQLLRNFENIIMVK